MSTRTSHPAGRRPSNKHGTHPVDESGDGQVEVVGGTAARRFGPLGAAPARPIPARRPIHPVPAPTNGQRPISRDVVREVENGQVVWRIRCGDLINRDRCVTVSVDRGQVVVTGPPGETARLTPAQIGQLKAVLTEAAKLAER